MVNHVGIYESRAAEGLSVFQRRFCNHIKNITKSPKSPGGHSLTTGTCTSLVVSVHFCVILGSVLKPIRIISAMHGAKNCQIWYQQGPNFVECTSLKPMDRFSPFKILWNCLGL